MNKPSIPTDDPRAVVRAFRRSYHRGMFRNAALIVVLGIGLGLGLSAIGKRFHIRHSVMSRGLTIASIVLVVVSIPFAVRFYREFGEELSDSPGESSRDLKNE